MQNFRKTVTCFTVKQIHLQNIPRHPATKPPSSRTYLWSWIYHPHWVHYKNKLLGLSQLHYLLARLQYEFINTTNSHYRLQKVCLIFYSSTSAFTWSANDCNFSTLILTLHHSFSKHLVKLKNIPVYIIELRFAIMATACIRSTWQNNLQDWFQYFFVQIK